MIIKRKNIVLVMFTSLIIAVIIGSTLLGYSLYLKWKGDMFSIAYKTAIFKLTAKMVGKDIEIHSVKTSVIKGGNSVELPVIEGKIKNNTDKKITSIMIELSFSKPDGYVVYRDWFYPLGEESLPSSPFFSSLKKNKETLQPGGSMEFEYVLRNCPSEISEFFIARSKFAKQSSAEDIKIELHVSGVSIL